MTTCHYCPADCSTNYYMVRELDLSELSEFRVCNKCYRKHKYELRFVFRHTSALKEVGDGKTEY